MLRATFLFLFVHALFWTLNAKPCPKSLHADDSIPKLTLPWGTYKGEFYGEDQETVLYKNIRFGKEPRGNLRFAAPEYPDAIDDNSEIQPNSKGPNCVQAKLPKNKKFTPEPYTDANEDEDCLFLDVYVPSWALDPDLDEKLPVIVWIFGGAYFFGGKNTVFELATGPFNAYDGQGFRDITDNGVIWVTGNYRLGAYGFLAGSYMEEHAQPNAGLHDQRLVLDWVQKYIGKIGGDKDNVNLWGLSAGGGSIVHHLTAYGGKEETPPFKRAAIWSTAYQWQYDRPGTLQQTFDNFADKANCNDEDDVLKCLRDAKDDVLKNANQELVSNSLKEGMFPFGPAVDGDLVPDLPAVLLSKGQHVKIESIIMSHNLNESGMFIRQGVETEDDFSKFVELAFPGDDLWEVREAIKEKYPSHAYDSQRDRMEIVVRDSTFVCNNYQVYKAYKDKSKVYAAVYEIPPSIHGFDLFALIWNRKADISDILKVLTKDFPIEIPDVIFNIIESIWGYFGTTYQRYFGAHAIYGDPNYFNRQRARNWDVASDDGNQITNSLKAGLLYINPSFFGTGADPQVSAANCEFWNGVADQISGLRGNGVSKKNPVSFKKQGHERLRLVAEFEL